MKKFNLNSTPPTPGVSPERARLLDVLDQVRKDGRYKIGFGGPWCEARKVESALNSDTTVLSLAMSGFAGRFRVH